MTDMFMGTNTHLHMMETALITIFAIVACTNHEKPVGLSILPTSYQARNGDVVLRKGTGLTSRAVMFADGGSDYSHCGIVVIKNNKVMVVHAVPDEPDFEGDLDRVKLEPIEMFFSTIRASKGCVLRCKNEQLAKKSAQTALKIFQRGVLFDHNYDLSDTTKMYCCELVELSYQANGIELSEGKRHNVNFPGLKFRNVILPSDFLQSDCLQVIKVFND